jgi:hypothetical protein
MTLDEFLARAWDDHGDHPREVADRLGASFDLITAPADIPPFVRLLVHVCGAHLGQWQHGIELLESLRRLPAFDGGVDASGAIARNLAALKHCGGDAAALAGLADDDRTAALALAAAALAERSEFDRALAAYAEACLRAEATGLPPGSPAIRALAIAGNNLAAALEEKRDRTATETAGMVRAAEGGLRYWTLAGTWLEEERALHRLARSHLAAGDPGRAAVAARSCIDVCARNDAPAFERFFGQATLALAQRAAGDRNGFLTARQEAIELHRQVPAADRAWCESELSELEG